MIKKKISKKERKALLSHMEKKFGIPENVFKGYDFFSTRKKIYVCSKECARDEFFTRSETAGIAFVTSFATLMMSSIPEELFIASP